jgi:cytochrome bd-type quinol oxidase subunit 2
MRTTTVVLQWVCAAIGALFVFLALTLPRDNVVFCAVLGSVMFLFAAFLGADHTTNDNKASRRLFKLLALLSAAPVAVVGVVGLTALARESRWFELLASAAKLGVFAAGLLILAFDEHPRVRALIRRLSFSAPKN